MRFSGNFEEVLAAFNRHTVNYMVVGGYAVNFHGYERNTSDLDIWVKSTKENIGVIAIALHELGFDDESIQHVQGFDINTPFLFHIGFSPHDVEVFNFVTGVKYEEAEPHRILFSTAQNLPVYFISINDLILNKMLTNRTQDKLDVEMLQRIQKL